MNRPLESGRILHIRAMLALSICYSANIGGIGTLVGTPPNVVMSDYLNEFDGQPVTFGTWMAFAIPQLLLCLLAAWLWLYIYFLGMPGCKGGDDESKERERVRNEAVHAVISKKYDEMGGMSFHEVMVMLIFLATFILWFFLSPGGYDILVM